MATVTVEVNVEHADLIAEGDLQGFSYRSWTHHCTHGAIAKVVIIGYGVEIVREDNPT